MELKKSKAATSYLNSILKNPTSFFTSYNEIDEDINTDYTGPEVGVFHGLLLYIILSWNEILTRY